MGDGETPARRLDRWLARGAAATTALATLTLLVSLFLGVEAVATAAAPYYALVVPAVAAGALVVVAMLSRAALAVRRWRASPRRSTRAVSLLRSVAFVVELGVVVVGAAAVWWGFGVGDALRAGGPVAVPSARVVYGPFGLFVLVVGCLPVYFRSARRVRYTRTRIG